MANRRTVARLHISLVGMVVLLVAVFVSPGTAAAHTDFDSSTPTDGSIVDGPLTTVVVEFTNPAIPSGEGFQLLDPDGLVREPASLDPTDGTTFIATFDPPLGAGEYGFRWDVQAGDAHRSKVPSGSPSSCPRRRPMRCPEPWRSIARRPPLRRRPLR